jgi:hypothetical protein
MRKPANIRLAENEIRELLGTAQLLKFASMVPIGRPERWLVKVKRRVGKRRMSRTTFVGHRQQCRHKGVRT